MKAAELENAERRMQQQWYDLVLAEREGVSLEVLEQMYDSYILLAEEYVQCSEEFQRENQFNNRGTLSKRKHITQPISIKCAS